MSDIHETNDIEEKDTQDIETATGATKAADTTGTEDAKGTEHFGETVINEEADETDELDELEDGPTIPDYYVEAFGAPALMGYESMEEFMTLWGLFVMDIEPRGMQEWLWSRVLADLAWETRRYRRMKSYTLAARAQRPYEKGAFKLDENKKDTAAKEPSPLQEANVAAGFAIHMQIFENFEGLIISLEKRYNKIFREIEASRWAQAKWVRKTFEKVVTCENVSLAPTDDADAQAGKFPVPKKTTP